MKKYFLLILALLPSLAFTQQTTDDYKIVETKTGKIISLDDLVKSLEKTNVLVFGEEHNDSIGHLVEAGIFQKMLLAYPGTALSLEMFSTDVQPVVNEYLLGLISEKNFIKEAKAWNNYNDYKPLLELAKNNHAEVIAANVATRYSNAVSMSGLEKLQQFPAASKQFLPPLPIDTATGRYHEKFIETLGGHDMGSMKIFQTQNLWDASMAWSVAKYVKLYPKKKVLQINGRFHSDERIGVVAQLKKYAPKLNVSNISCFTVDGTDDGNLKKYELLGDYIIITRPAKAK